MNTGLTFAAQDVYGVAFGLHGTVNPGVVPAACEITVNGIPVGLRQRITAKVGEDFTFHVSLPEQKNPPDMVYWVLSDGQTAASLFDCQDVRGV